MSAKYDLTSPVLIKSGYRPLHAGDDYDHRFTIERAGAPMNLTGAKIWFTVKEQPEDTDAEALLQYISSNPSTVEISDAVNGKFVIHFQASDTTSLAGTWLYDIQVRLVTNKIITVARGSIEFLPHMTLTRI